MLRDNWYRQVSLRTFAKSYAGRELDPTSSKGSEAGAGEKGAAGLTTARSVGRRHARKSNSPKNSLLAHLENRPGSWLPHWLLAGAGEFQTATWAVLSIYIPRNPTKVLLWTFISTILIHFSLWVSNSIGTYSYNSELAIGAIAGWLYLLNFLRAVRPIGHFIVILSLVRLRS